MFFWQNFEPVVIPGGHEVYSHQWIFVADTTQFLVTGISGFVIVHLNHQVKIVVTKNIAQFFNTSHTTKTYPHFDGAKIENSIRGLRKRHFYKSTNQEHNLHSLDFPTLPSWASHHVRTTPNNHLRYRIL